MKSMTGFTQKRFDFEGYSLNITLKSLNHKYLDIFFKGNGITPMVEKLYRDIIKNKLSRGKIEVSFDVMEFKSDDWDIHLDEKLLRRVLGRIVEIKKEFGDNINLNLDNFLKIPMIFHIDSSIERGFEKPSTKKKIVLAMQEVLEDLILCRKLEGDQLAKIISDSIKKIDKSVKDLELLIDGIEEDIFQKYTQKISRFVKEYEIDERRIAQEAAIAVEKSCISEEIGRIKVHSDRLSSIINQNKNQSQGKEMDFITQEILRETHTIGAKTNSSEVQDNILLIRREIEKIRQQVQNVE